MTRRGGAARCSYVGLGASSLHRFRLKLLVSSLPTPSIPLGLACCCLMALGLSWLWSNSMWLRFGILSRLGAVLSLSRQDPTRLKCVAGSVLSSASAVRLFLQDCISPHTMQWQYACRQQLLGLLFYGAALYAAGKPGMLPPSWRLAYFASVHLASHWH